MYHQFLKLFASLMQGSSSKVTVGKRSSRNKSQHPSSSQVYSEVKFINILLKVMFVLLKGLTFVYMYQKLRSWKERSHNNNNNNNNRDFSQLYGNYRDVHSKQNNKNKNRTYATEHVSSTYNHGFSDSICYLRFINHWFNVLSGAEAEN